MDNVKQNKVVPGQSLGRLSHLCNGKFIWRNLEERTVACGWHHCCARCDCTSLSLHDAAIGPSVSGTKALFLSNWPGHTRAAGQQQLHCFDFNVILKSLCACHGESGRGSGVLEVGQDRTMSSGYPNKQGQTCCWHTPANFHCHCSYRLNTTCSVRLLLCNYGAIQFDSGDNFLW